MSKQLEYREFKVLELLESQKGEALTQRELAAGLSVSVGTVNRVVAKLVERGLVASGAITGAGVAALEPYRVRRAVFIAAGFGSRMVPITLNTPKPLVRVHGKRIVDSLLDAVVAARTTEGGTAPEAVEAQFRRARARCLVDESSMALLSAVIDF